MKKTFLILVVLLFPTISWAAEEANCTTKVGYEKYTCNIKNSCENQEFNEKKPLVEIEKYQNAEEFKGNGWINTKAFEEAQKIYKANMSNIYKCAIISSQKIALKKTKELLKIEKTGTVDDKIGRKIDLQFQKLELASGTIWCKNQDDKNVYNKKNVLNETTLEICKYVHYLEYLKVYYSDLNNLVEPNTNSSTYQEEKIASTYLSEQIFSILQKLDYEQSRSYIVASTTFGAYSQYENNLIVHIFLQIIKEDYVIIREKLYQAINPINQVVYKISNAMQK